MKLPILIILHNHIVLEQHWWLEMSAHDNTSTFKNKNRNPHILTDNISKYRNVQICFSHRKYCTSNAKLAQSAFIWSKDFSREYSLLASSLISSSFRRCSSTYKWPHKCWDSKSSIFTIYIQMPVRNIKCFQWSWQIFSARNPLIDLYL